MELLGSLLLLSCFNLLQVLAQQQCSSEGSVSIRSGSSTSSTAGRVEYCLRTGDGSLYWAVVCNSTFQLNEAHVACRTVNPTYTAYTTLPGADFSQIGLNHQVEVQCGGYESSLAGCNVTEVPSSSMCNMTASAAGLSCNTGEVENSVILVGSEIDTEGYVMIFRTSSWHFLTAASAYWTDTHAGVVCRQLGYSGGVVPSNTDGYSRPVVLAKYQANFECTSSARGLGECSQTQQVVPSDMPAAVSCTLSDDADGTLRLSRGSTDGDSQGELEIAFNGRYGAVCSSDFGSQEAEVACRQLGYNSSSYTSSNVFASRPHYLSGLGCSGSESSLLDCTHNSPLGTTCSSGIGVHVTCSLNQMDRSPDATEPEEEEAVLSGAEIAGIVMSSLLVLLMIFLCSVYHKKIEAKTRKLIIRIQDWRCNQRKQDHDTTVINMAVLSLNLEAPAAQPTSSVLEPSSTPETESVILSLSESQPQDPTGRLLSAEAPPSYQDADKFQMILEEDALDLDEPPPYLDPVDARSIPPPPVGGAAYELPESYLLTSPTHPPAYPLVDHAYSQTYASSCDTTYSPPPPDDFSCPPPPPPPPPPPQQV